MILETHLVDWRKVFNVKHYSCPFTAASEPKFSVLVDGRAVKFYYLKGQLRQPCNAKGENFKSFLSIETEIHLNDGS